MTIPTMGAVAMAGGGIWSTCALRADRTLECTGYDSQGQLGNGIVGPPSLSLTPVSLANATSVSVGGYQACAVVGGTPFCWGAANGGGMHSMPTSIGVTNATRITAGIGFACVLLADETIECLGQNGLGQLGDGSMTTRMVPSPVKGLPPAIDVAVGMKNACAVGANNTVWCWGDNSHLQLGNGSMNENSTVPVQVTGIDSAIQVVVGTASVCVRIKSGHVWCWGENDSGQLGDGTTVDRAAPVEVVGLTDVEEIALSAGHACGLLNDGHVMCWGANGGALGNGATANSPVPVQLVGIP